MLDCNFTYWYSYHMKNEISHGSFHGFTVKDAATLSGFPYVTVWRHLNKQRTISPEAAIRYHSTLGIPLTVLRPDLWPPAAPSTPTGQGEVNHELA